MPQTRSPEEIRQSIEANRAELAMSLERLRGEVAQVTDWRTPPGTAAPAGGAGSGERPEIQVGLAFAGGLGAALLLKVLTR